MAVVGKVAFEIVRTPMGFSGREPSSQKDCVAFERIILRTNTSFYIPIFLFSFSFELLFSFRTGVEISVRTCNVHSNFGKECPLVQTEYFKFKR